ncbi:MAG: malonyl-CoA O-methyltransferase [Blastocatellia bacterium]|jgi:ubiquinone/menaquinone biosynthesis C-methylase UbiE|nr:malonyl-CoA O-methyltransferase [Blastocatellia bacterium]
MADELNKFMPTGLTWVQRAKMGELKAVISPTASDRGNDFHHSVHLYGATKALGIDRPGNAVLDFGCGTGRFMRFFGDRGLFVIGTEITQEMLSEARRLGLPRNASLLLTDGVSIPVGDNSIDMIWCCAVLRYSLFVSQPVYHQIAKEMYRALKPGGSVVNLEMYVDSEPESFTRDFEQVGFVTRDIRVLKRYAGFVEDCLKSHLFPPRFVSATGKLWAALHYWFDKPGRPVPGLRDYLFVWSKPK